MVTELNVSRVGRETHMGLHESSQLQKKQALFPNFVANPLGSAEMSQCLLLCVLLPAPHPMLSSSEAMYSMDIPWDGCSSPNPHSFIGCTQVMFSKPFANDGVGFHFF